MKNTTKLLVPVAAIVAAISVATAGWAYWGALGAGSGSATVGTLGSPVLSAPTASGTTVSLGWSTVTPPGNGSVGYYVLRDGTAASTACGSSSSTISTTTCSDTGVPVGSHSYTVTAVYRTWTALSNTRSATVTAPPTITTTSLPAATQGQAGYSQTLTSSGGTGTVTWSLQAGSSLPSGLSLSSAGVISGTVGAAASSSAFTVVATDANGGTATQSLTITVNSPPSVTTTSLLAATQGQAGYSQTLTSSGGTGTITWTLQAGSSLPSGLSLSSAGVISGDVGASAATSTFTVVATDVNGVSGTRQLTITVNQPLRVTAITSTSVASPGKAGQVDVGDTFSVTFNNALDPSTINTTAGVQTLTLCSNLSACSAQGHTLIKISGLTAAAGFDVTSLYEKDGNQTTAAGTLSLSNGNKTVTFTVTSISTNANGLKQGSSVTFTFVPLATIRDINANAATTSFNQSSSITLF